NLRSKLAAEDQAGGHMAARLFSFETYFVAPPSRRLSCGHPARIATARRRRDSRQDAGAPNNKLET
ncbi:MAG TPA: hypothetical protein VFM10_02990, partial [Terriglobales bacterium]|nr:hypothetical protein [Terriglobales bacterium]